MSATESELTDPALLGEVDLARAAAQEEAGDEEVGAHVGAQVEGSTAVTHLFEAAKPGYHGWRWAVTVASGGPDTDVTVSEVVLLPGPVALVAPEWVPWENRVKAGDLGVGDLMPTAPDDPRLVPAYVSSDDPAVEEVAREVGLGRPRVMARPARLEAAARWQHSEFGPRSDMARSAPAHCGTCGFYLPLAGSLRAAFGTCGNEISPADGHVVHAEYGCGAHSEAEVEQVSPVLVANLIYDDAQLDVAPLPQEAPAKAPTAETPPAETPPAEAPPAEAPTADAPTAEAPAAELSAPAAPTAETPIAEASEQVAAEAPAEMPAAIEAREEMPAAAEAPAETPMAADARKDAPAAAEVPAEAVTESSAVEAVPSPAQPVEEVAPASSVWTEPPAEPDIPAEQPVPASSVWTEPVSDEPAAPPVEQPTDTVEPDQATDPTQPEESRPEDADATTNSTTEATPNASTDAGPNASSTDAVLDATTNADADLNAVTEVTTEATEATEATTNNAATEAGEASEASEASEATTDTAAEGTGEVGPGGATEAGPDADQPQLFDDESRQTRMPWVGQRWFEE
jgi:Protein of unknown function (DUF3027)